MNQHSFIEAQDLLEGHGIKPIDLNMLANNGLGFNTNKNYIPFNPLLDNKPRSSSNNRSDKYSNFYTPPQFGGGNPPFGIQNPLFDANNNNFQNNAYNFQPKTDFSAGNNNNRGRQFVDEKPFQPMNVKRDKSANIPKNTNGFDYPRYKPTDNPIVEMNNFQKPSNNQPFGKTNLTPTSAQDYKPFDQGNKINPEVNKIIEEYKAKSNSASGTPQNNQWKSPSVPNYTPAGTSTNPTSGFAQQYGKYTPEQFAPSSGVSPGYYSPQVNSNPSKPFNNPSNFNQYPGLANKPTSQIPAYNPSTNPPSKIPPYAPSSQPYAYTPSTPAYVPSTPAYVPSTPAYTPTTPAYTPSTPAYTPTTPAYTPSTPAYTPKTPAYTPSTPAYIPSIQTTPAYTPQSNLSSSKQNVGMDLLRSKASPFLSTDFGSSSQDVPQISEKYTKALKQCAQTRQEFVDYEFPASEKSVATNANLNEYRGLKKWLRPKQIYGTDDFDLYHKFIEPNDIQQGNLGDCAFLSAVSALAVHPESIKKIFINKKKSEFGLYGLNLIWKGVQTEVIVDDFIPVDAQNRPYFHQSKEKELWAFLLEKAWAKLHKNYHCLSGQLTKECLHDLTGAPVRNYNPQTANQEDLWMKIFNAKNKFKSTVTAGTEGDDTGDNKDPLKKRGLVSGHAYSIIGAYEVDYMKYGQLVKEKLLKLRNPWGTFEWNQTFSDKDSAWKDITQSTQLRIDKKDEDDGIFFMPFSRFREFFDTVDICHLLDGYNYFGVKCRSKYDQYKYFRVQIKQESDCFFFVSQLSIRSFDEDYQFVNPKEKGHYSETKFCIGDSSGNIIQKIKGKKRDLFSPKYLDNENRQKFKPGVYYAFVLVQWQRYATHSFGFGVYAKNVTIQELTNPNDAQPILEFSKKLGSDQCYDPDVESVYGRV